MGSTLVDDVDAMVTCVAGIMICETTAVETGAEKLAVAVINHHLDLIII